MCGPLVSRTDADFERFTRLHGVDAALSQHAPVKERVAGPIREFRSTRGTDDGKRIDKDD
jgi:hypothetical protein